MKLYRYWVKSKFPINLQDEASTITCYAGSNESIKDAEVKSLEQAKRIQKRIAGEQLDHDGYEVAIREEIIDVINEKNIVTRTRYGALVLNSEDLVFIDIDELPSSITGGLASFFGFKKKLTQEEKLIELIKAQLEKPAYRNLSIRAYATCKGFPPDADHTHELLEAFHCDRLYQYLCKKQQCFRARLTPKPYRMKCVTHKVIFPRETEEQNQSYQQWVDTYDQHRDRFDTCHLIDSFGAPANHPAITWHDRVTGANRSQKLA